MVSASPSRSGIALPIYAAIQGCVFQLPENPAISPAGGIGAFIPPWISGETAGLATEIKWYYLRCYRASNILAERMNSRRTLPVWLRFCPDVMVAARANALTRPVADFDLQPILNAREAVNRHNKETMT